MMVVDGNMKNHRDVCFASSAGYVEYKGLPGRIQTGCPNTPDFKSSYCSLHKPVTIQHSSASCSTSGIENQSTSPGRNNKIGLIIGKCDTRQGSLYEVCCK